MVMLESMRPDGAGLIFTCTSSIPLSFRDLVSADSASARMRDESLSPDASGDSGNGVNIHDFRRSVLGKEPTTEPSSLSTALDGSPEPFSSLSAQPRPPSLALSL